MFSKHYKLLVKSSSQKEMLNDDIQKKMENEDENMFKSNLLKKPKLFLFLLLWNSSKQIIKESNEKSLNYIKKVLNIINPLGLNKKIQEMKI